MVPNVFFVTGEELSSAFASADVFMMPSDSETLGFVVLESMASGVPVVAANAGGIPDLVENVSSSTITEGEGGKGRQLLLHHMGILNCGGALYHRVRLATWYQLVTRRLSPIV